MQPLRGQGIDPEAFTRSTYTQFQTWLAESGAVEGCPVDCAYCFFKLDGQTPKRPDIRLSPEESVAMIGQLPTYHAEMPIHFGSQTDAFATPRNIAHYAEVLKRYGDSSYPNPVVFITKRSIPEAFLAIVESIRQPVVCYISYSGLGGTGLEPTVRNDVLRENFVRLAARGLPRVHYWRPFVPQNSQPRAIAEMLEFVSEYATCSAVNGLKLNDGIRAHVSAFWPQLLDRDYDFTQTGDFWPTGVRQFIRGYAAEHHADYPLYFDTACSLAYAIGQPDIQGAFGGSMCLDSGCPRAQRNLCAGAFQVPQPAQLAVAGEAVGIQADRLSLDAGRITVRGDVSTELLTYLRSRLRYPVVASQVDYRGHNWASNIDVEQSIVEVPWE